ncbi:MAG: hypothetical protein OEZ32_08720 [Nitrospinota bacterium]|nr:hypothetical protein [Nitrospinota bacterium]
MSLQSITAIHAAARLLRSDRKNDAAKRLALAVDQNVADHRVGIRLALLSADYSPLLKAAQEGRGGRAAWLFLALERALANDYAKAEEFARRALDMTPNNMTAQALFGLARFRRTGDLSKLRQHVAALPHAAMKVQGLILLAVEQSIAKANPSDTGAEEKDDRTTGSLGRVLDLLDDLAIWIYWLISVALNLVINALDPAKRRIYWKVIEGDRLEGLGKDDLALEQFAMALELSPGCVEALESMMKHSMARGKYDETERYLNRLLAILGEAGAADPSLLKMQADLAFFQRQFGKATPLYERLQPQFQLSYIIPYRIGLCLLAGGDDRRAVEYFEQALSQVNPGLLRERVGP